MSVKEALLVLGMQHDFVYGDVSEKGNEQVVPLVNQAIKEFDLCFMCLDFSWLRRLREAPSNPWDLEDYGMREAGGAMLVPELEFPNNVRFVHMGSRESSLSAFDGHVYNCYKQWSREPYGEEDSLISILRGFGVTLVGVCGLPMGAVKKTALDALDHGLSVAVFDDAVAGSQKEQVLRSLEKEERDVGVILTRTEYERRHGAIDGPSEHNQT